LTPVQFSPEYFAPVSKCQVKPELGEKETRVGKLVEPKATLGNLVIHSDLQNGENFNVLNLQKIGGWYNESQFKVCLQIIVRVEI
jgi:hypothetical protein